MKLLFKFNRHLPSPARRSLAGMFWIAALILVSGASSCSKDAAGSSDGPTDRREVEFYSVVTGYERTRAADSQWFEDDEIGVFMYASADTPSASNALEANKRYYTPSASRFVPFGESDRIYIDEEMAPVDFIAYYPYTDALDGMTYKLDVSDQSIHEEIDLMYSNGLKGVTYENNSGLLSFSHQLARVTFNVTVTDGVSLAPLIVRVHGMKTRADFDLLNGELTPVAGSEAVITLPLRTTSSGRTADGILIPVDDVSGCKVEFILGTETFEWKFPAGLKLEKGQRYPYGVKLNSSQPPTVEPAKDWVEIPATRVIENTQIARHMLPDRPGRNYSLLYDSKYKMAYWVAYPLVDWHVGSYKRDDNWIYDPIIPMADQPDLTEAYVNGTTWQRGHQLPSKDRTYSGTANATTFYFTNCTPQYGSLNGGKWQVLEEMVRTWATQCDTLYVVTGAGLPDDLNQVEYHESKRGDIVAKPAYYYKALAKRTGDTYYTTAYKFDNGSNPSDAVNNYRMTVKELEELTGFTFFPSLPDEVKSTVVTSQW